MTAIDRRFLALGERIDLSKYVVCTYVFQTGIDPMEAAVDLCKSQSTSSAGWGDTANVEGETDKIIDEFGAKLLDLKELGSSERPNLPLVNRLQASRDGLYRTVEVRMALPLGNLSDNIPLLLTAAAGEIHYLPAFISVKWVDVSFPDAYLNRFKGPRFGTQGIRELSGTDEDTPLVIAVVKPSLCSPQMFANLAYQAASGGVHMVKEDELLVDIPRSPLEERVRLAVAAVRRAEDLLGRRIFYQPNITGNVEDLRRNYDIVRNLGADSVMVNAIAIGLSATRYVVGFSDIPVASHFDLTACHAKVPFFGISHKVLAILHRLTGIDNLVVPAFGDTMMEYEQDIHDELQGCSMHLGGLRVTLPFLGGGVKATNVPYILSKAGTNNVGLIVGHGIYGHPDGPIAGTKSVFQAVGAYRQGVSLTDYARDHAELARALEKWPT